jgi:AcrR family transcriptional regulator
MAAQIANIAQDRQTLRAKLSEVIGERAAFFDVFFAGSIVEQQIEARARQSFRAGQSNATKCACDQRDRSGFDKVIHRGQPTSWFLNQTRIGFARNFMKPSTAQQSRQSIDTRERILLAGTKVFAHKGFDGARVDAIAAAAKINKQRLYHYFGNKDSLFTAVLERAYRGLREAEASLDLDPLPANEAIVRLVEFTWEYYLAHPELIRLLNSENQLEARHLKATPSTREINAGHIELMRRLILRGRREKTIRHDIDVLHLSINIAALSYFYLMNRHTLSTVFEQDLVSERSLKSRLRVMKDNIARWIEPERKGERKAES